MKNLSPIELLACAIATTEGFFVEGSLPLRNHNPGDLRASPLQRPKDVHGFVQFASIEEGIAALYHQITLMATRGLTIREIITVWAPKSDGNDTERYIRDVGRRTGLNVDYKLWNYLPCINLYSYVPNPTPITTNTLQGVSPSDLFFLGT